MARVYIKMRYSMAIENPIHGVMRFIQLFLLLSTITMTTYGVIFCDAVAIEGGFKAAIVLLAYDAITQSIGAVIVTALSVLVLLTLFYSTHLYYDIIEYTVIYSMICLLIFALYDSWKQNYYRRRTKVADFEAVTLFYVVISSAWVTIKEGIIWVITLTTVVVLAYKVLLPKIKVLGVFGLLNSFIKFGGLSNILSILVKICNNTSLKFSRGNKGFCKLVTSWSEVGKRIDYCLTNKSIALLKFMSRRFLEIENKFVERFHTISLAIERFQYIMEHTFVLLLFLASIFVLVAILMYILIVSQ
ncbi:MAG: hypothetical protein QXU78_03265 [Sulfolobales archaeon]